MFKQISEAYAVLSNPQRRKKYDLWGETGNDDGLDDGMDDVFAQMFGDMDDLFGMGPMGGGMDDIDEFIKILEGDNIKQFNKMFRDLGKNYRVNRQKPGNMKNIRARANKKGKQSKLANREEEEMMEQMMAMMMMGDMMNMDLNEDDIADMENGFGFKMPGSKKNGKASKSKASKKKQKDDDGWETDSDGADEVLSPKDTD